MGDLAQPVPAPPQSPSGPLHTSAASVRVGCCQHLPGRPGVCRAQEPHSSDILSPLQSPPS